MLKTNHQRKGATSNAAAGKDFELAIKEYWAVNGLILTENYPISLGISSDKKLHRFDLGSDSPKVILECKSHRWTEGNKIPSAKLTVWNEAMYYFLLCPTDYRKIFCCLKDYSNKRNCTLAEYYIRIYNHLIPNDVEIWEFCELSKQASCLRGKASVNS